MYPVSEAFLRAVQENTRRYYWTGRITTKGGAVYPFGYEDIVKGSGYIFALDLCQYFGQKKSKDYAAFLSSSSSFCCGVK